MTNDGLDAIHGRYLDEHPLGTLATISPRGWPQAKPVAFRYNRERETIDITGHTMEQSAKFRNVSVNPRVAFTVDDVPDPSSGAAGVRFMEVRGIAMQVQLDTPPSAGLSAWIIRIYPRRLVSYNVGAPGFHTANFDDDQVSEATLGP